MSTPVKFIVQFMVVMAIQVFILNDIMLHSSLSVLGFPVFTPIIYPMIILLLPVNTPHALLMGLAFITGLTMDMFSNTPGMNAFAMVFISFLRPTVLKLFFQQTPKELKDAAPTLYKLGLTSFIIYIAFCLLIHHLLFYILQIWSFSSILIILGKTLVSLITSVILVILAQLLFAKRESHRL